MKTYQLLKWEPPYFKIAYQKIRDPEIYLE
jgi:hypothetical protein